jgi:hypothetical protein
MKASLQKYLPGILLFAIAMVIACLTYQDYGVAWDEPLQREPGVLSYEYAFNGNQDLFVKPNDFHGAGFEILLMIIEKKGGITSMRDVYLMRHLVTHIFFLLGALAGYVLAFRLFKNQWLACLGFLMLVLMPRLYAHSFFNTKDLPFFAMFIITMAAMQAAFENRSKWQFLLLGISAGYMTAIRIMGIMPVGIVLFFLAFDLIKDRRQKERVINILVNALLFILGFCFMTYVSWPYLWKQPFHTFIEGFKRLSHFDWAGEVFYNGKMERGDRLSWYYMPVWMGITIPILWILLGLGGMVWVVVEFLRKPLLFLNNTRERNFIISLGCFVAPLFAVIFMHSVVYDDWRHLYFIYPPFVILGLYFIDKLKSEKARTALFGMLGFQISLVLGFMIQNHPHHQVYFNEFVSHKEDYLRKHYDMDYWGVSFKQALDHLTRIDRDEIKIHTDVTGNWPLENNIALMQDRDRARVHITSMEDADYFITDFRGHPSDYDYGREIYSHRVLGSKIVAIYKLK